MGDEVGGEGTVTGIQICPKCHLRATLPTAFWAHYPTFLSQFALV